MMVTSKLYWNLQHHYPSRCILDNPPLLLLSAPGYNNFHTALQLTGIILRIIGHTITSISFNMSKINNFYDNA